MPDFAHLLPEPIRRFTQPAEIHDAEHLSFIQGGGHGGSHPHLVNEFVTALVKKRAPLAQRHDQRQLDLRRHLRPSIGRKRRQDREAAGIYADLSLASLRESRLIVACEADAAKKIPLLP